VIDKFCARFLYVYSGHLFADYVFALSDRPRACPILPLLGADPWQPGCIGHSELPVVPLMPGLAGPCAITRIGTLIAQARGLT